jgi:hypothetical protein
MFLSTFFNFFNFVQVSISSIKLKQGLQSI